MIDMVHSHRTCHFIFKILKNLLDSVVGVDPVFPFLSADRVGRTGPISVSRGGCSEIGIWHFLVNGGFAWMIYTDGLYDSHRVV